MDVLGEHYEPVKKVIKVETDNFLVTIRKDDGISINAKQDDYPGAAALVTDCKAVLEAADAIVGLPVDVRGTIIK